MLLLFFCAETFVSLVVGYTGVFNVLDYACVSFPTGMSVEKTIDLPLGDAHQPLSDICGEIHAECEFLHSSHSIRLPGYGN